MSQTPVELELELEKAPDDLSMYEEYFYLTQKHKKEQGDRTVVLLNCGIFYEIYGYANEQGDVIGSDIVYDTHTSLRFISHCGLKNESINIIMIGSSKQYPYRTHAIPFVHRLPILSVSCMHACTHVRHYTILKIVCMT